MTKDESFRGIKISFVNLFFTVLTGIVFCFILLISNNVKNRFNDVNDSMSKFIICQQSSEKIKESANYLTEQARLFVVTGSREHLDSYLKEYLETRSQQKAFRELEKVCSKSDLALQRLRIALEQGNGLIEMELYAMRLVCEAMQEKDLPTAISKIAIGDLDKSSSPQEMKETAINNLFGDGYMIYKLRLNSNCQLTVAAIEQQIKKDLNMNADQLGSNIRRLRVLFFVLLIVNVFIFIGFGFLVILPLGKFRTSIENDEKLDVIGSLEFKSLAESYNEIYEIKAQNEKSLLKKAEYDGLTGILNRRAFDQICETSAQKEQKIALLLIDMDNFKNVNDTYGHLGGDNALKSLAAALSETFRDTDYVARVGGDEFAAILPNCDASAANAIKKKIERINKRLSQLAEHFVSVSVGVAFSDNGFSKELYDKADKALYMVKERGKRGCEVYES
jgi:diguanylate cyclase (GGDEF)-like protein